ncbi:MAG: SDR family NAD(P)-dependent oxidoreductase [Halothiobacillaceae bacterium]
MRNATVRHVLITGCSSGIGRCVAEGLQARGHRVVATARRAEDVAALEASGLVAARLDLDDSDSTQQGFSEALERLDGRLDALFNNGAWGLPGAVEDLSRAALAAQLQTNLLGWLELTNLAIPVMRAQQFGRIIQNSSVLGLAAFPYRGAYVASKFALEGLSDTLRLELRGSGIDVCLIEPGPIESRFRANALRAFEHWIDPHQSVHAKAYAAQLDRMRNPGPAAPFTLPPDAVLRRVIHALESRRPRARYPVTLPTRVFGTLRRLLPTRLMDRVLLAASGGGKR